MNEVASDILRSALRQSVPAHSAVLLAVSGGIDSVALLHGLVDLSAELELALEVVHIDHKLREDSARDADFVRSLCELYKLPFHLCEAEEPPLSGENLEAWGRRLRYRHFKTIREKQNLDFVLTAHNANDVAETFLMKIFANKELKTIESRDSERGLIRPFLGIRRETLERYLQDNSYEFITDKTNFDCGFTRNRIRHRIIPFIESELGGELVEILVKSATRVADDIAFIDSFADQSVKKIESNQSCSKEWLKQVRLELESLPETVSFRVVQKLLHPHLGFSLGKDRCLDVAKFFLGEALRIQLPSGVTLQRRGGGIAVLRTDS